MTREARTEMLQVRVTGQDKARLDEQARALGMTVSDFIRFRTLPDRVWRKEPANGSERAAAGPVDRTSRVSVSSPAEYRCPVSSCSFRAGSGSARCPTHGRRVVAGL